MSKLIPPSIGRRVWYYPSQHDLGVLDSKPESVVHCDGTQPCDAGVVYVHGNRLVNLLVTDHNGYTHRRPSVTLVQPGDTKPSGGAYCEWMPYQVQASSMTTAQPSNN